MLTQTIKKVARQTQQAADPAAFLFGQVTSLAPLTVMVDNRFPVSAPALVVMRGFRAGDEVDHIHDISPHAHQVPAAATDSTDQPAHTHQVPAAKTEKAEPGDHQHDIKARDTAAAGQHTHRHQIAARQTGALGLQTAGGWHLGLQVGDKVVLLRNDGGQQFLVLGRV